jgi:hypothetical protein
VFIERPQRQPSSAHVASNQNKAKQCRKSLIVLYKREFLHGRFAKSGIQRLPCLE